MNIPIPQSGRGRPTLSLISHSRPLNPLEYVAQLLTPCWIDRFHKSYASFEVRPKLWMLIPVLVLRTGTDAVGESRLQTVEIGSDHIGMPIRHQTNQMLPHSLSHDASLAMIHTE